VLALLAGVVVEQPLLNIEIELDVNEVEGDAELELGN